MRVVSGGSLITEKTAQSTGRTRAQGAAQELKVQRNMFRRVQTDGLKAGREGGGGGGGGGRKGGREGVAGSLFHPVLVTLMTTHVLTCHGQACGLSQISDQML